MNDFLSLLPDGWAAEVAQAKADVREIVTLVANGSGKMREFGNKLEMAKTFREGAAAARELQTAENTLVDATGRLISRQQELNGLEAQANQLIAQHNGHSKELAEVMRKLAQTAVDEARAVKEAAAAEAQKAKASREASAAGKEAAQANLAAAKATESKAKADLAAAKAEEARVRSQIAQERELDRQIALEAKSRAAQDASAQASARRAAQDNIAQDSLKQMSITLEQHRKSYYLLTQAERDNEHIGGVLMARIQELDAELKKQDGGMGKHTRHVGDYAGATAQLQNNLRNIAGELPNIGISLRTFGQAISNNVGPAVEAWKIYRAEHKLAQQAAREQAEEAGKQAKATALAGGASEEAASKIGELAKQQALATAEALKGGGAIRTIAKSMFSWGTIIALVITLVASYTDEIIEAFTGTSKASKEAEEANKKYTESLKEVDRSTRAAAAQEVARMSTLVRLAANERAAMDSRIGAINELKKQWPQYFAGLEREAFLHGDVAKQLRLASAATFQKAAADAYQQKFGKATAQAVDLQDQINDKKARQDALDEKYHLREIQRIRQRNEVLQAEFRERTNGLGLRDSNPEFRANVARLTELEDVSGFRAARKEFNELDGAVGILSLSLVRAQQDQVNFADGMQKAGDAAAAAIEAASVKGRTPQNIQKDLDAVNARIQVTVAGTKEMISLLAQQKKLQAELDVALGKEKKPKKVKDHTNDEIKAQEDLTSARYDELIKRAQIEADTQKDIADDEHKSLQERIAAHAAYSQQLSLIANLQETKELAIIDDKLAKIAGIEKKAAKDRTEAENDLLRQKAVLEQQKVNTCLTGERAQTKIVADETKFRTKAFEDDLAARRAAFKNHLDHINDVNDQQEVDELGALVAKLQSGEITIKQYQERRMALDAHYAGLRLRTLASELDREIRIEEAAGQDVTDLRKRLNEILKQLYEDDANNHNKSQKKKTRAETYQKELDGLDEVKRYLEKGAQAAQGISDIFSALSEQRQQNISKEIELINQQAEAEKQQVNATITNQADKEKALAAIDARADARRRVADEKLRAEKTKNAQQEKMVRLALMAVSGAATVIEEYLKEGPWAALAAGLAVGAQIAAAAATPIPSYAEGTDDHPGGKALIGEAGRQEVVQEPSGKVWLTKGPTIADLPRHTIVYPSIEEYAMEVMAGNMITVGLTAPHHDEKLAAAVRQGNVEMIRALGSEIRSLKKELKDSRFSPATQSLKFLTYRDKLLH